MPGTKTARARVRVGRCVNGLEVLAGSIDGTSTRSIPFVRKVERRRSRDRYQVGTARLDEVALGNHGYATANGNLDVVRAATSTGEEK